MWASYRQLLSWCMKKRKKGRVAEKRGVECEILKDDDSTGEAFMTKAFWANTNLEDVWFLVRVSRTIIINCEIVSFLRKQCLKKPSIDAFHSVQKLQSSVFKARKLWIVWSGCCSFNKSVAIDATYSMANPNFITSNISKCDCNK